MRCVLNAGPSATVPTRDELGPLAEDLDPIAQILTMTGIPGCTILVSVRGRTLVRAAWGWAVRPDTEDDCAAQPMLVDTLVDIASITKLAATTAAIMALVDRGDLATDQPVGPLVPELQQPELEQLTITDLLLHCSGLPAWAPLFLDCRDRDQALAHIGALAVHAEPGATIYSDLGMAVLGAALERHTGTRLDELARREVFDPLGMNSTRFGPLEHRSGVAATSFGNPVERRMLPVESREAARPDWWRPRTLIGEVNDANSAIAFGGISGHAGLFSTLDDLALLGLELLAPRKLFTAETVRDFTTPGSDPDQARGFWTRRLAHGLGWSSTTVDPSFGHRGFTGCELLVAPGDDLVVVMLTNRLHGDDPPAGHQPVWTAVLRAVWHHLHGRA